MFTAYSKFWKQYFDFKSRSKRADFWWPFLINAIVRIIFFTTIVIAVVIPYAERVAELTEAGLETEGISAWANLTPAVVVVMVLWGLFELATLIPTLAIGVRRLRDAAFHWAFIFMYGATLLLSFIPFGNIFSGILTIASIVLWAFPSREKTTKPSVILQPVMAPQPQFQPAQPQPVQQSAVPNPNNLQAGIPVQPGMSQPQPAAAPVQPGMPQGFAQPQPGQAQQPVAPVQPGQAQQPVAPVQPGQVQQPFGQPQADPNGLNQQPTNGQF